MADIAAADYRLPFDSFFHRHWGSFLYFLFLKFGLTYNKGTTTNLKTLGHGRPTNLKKRGERMRMKDVVAWLRFVFYKYSHITWTDIYLDLIHCLGLYSLLSFLHSDLLIKQHQAHAWWFLRMDLSVSSVVWALLPLRHQCSDYRADRVTSHFVRCTMVSHHPWEEWRSQGLKSPLNGSVSEVSIFPSSVLTHS